MKKKQNEQKFIVDRQNHVVCLQVAEVILVAFLLNLSFVFACKLLYNAYFPIGKINQVILCTVVSCVGILMMGAGKYFSMREKPFAETVSSLIGIIVMLDFVFISLLYFSMSVRLSPYLFVLTNILQITLLLLLKALFREGKQDLIEENRVLIISREVESHETLRQALAQNTRHVRCMTFEENNGQIQKAIRAADIIYLSDDLTKPQKDELISCCIFNDKNVYLVPETYEIALRRSELTQIGDVPVFNISSFRFTPVQTFAKRVLDILGAVVGLVLSSPIWIVAMILIKREDGGSIFFKQTRAGQAGKEFDVIKLRTMIPDAEKHTGAVLAQEDDPRITRIGKKLRAMRIDEIPQFLNVLKGEMSLVGPRPERPVFVKEFAESLPEYSGRLMAKPGITGLAQVLGYYTTTAANKAKFDLVYIRNYSIWLDIKILLKTVAVVFTKEQAAGVRIDDQSVDKNETILAVNADGAAVANTNDADEEIYNWTPLGRNDFSVNKKSSNNENLSNTINADNNTNATNIENSFGTNIENSFLMSNKMTDGLNKNLSSSYRDSSNGSGKKMRKAIYKGMKAVAVMMCILVALSGIVVLRYSNLLFQVMAEEPADGHRTIAAVAIIDAVADGSTDGVTGLSGNEADSSMGSVIPAGSVNGEGIGRDSDGKTGTAGEVNRGDQLAGSSIKTAAGTNGSLNGQIKPSATQTNKYFTSNQAENNTGTENKTTQADKRQAQFTDQANVVYKLVTKISTEDILIIEEMAKDGFTSAEKDAVRQIMAGYFTQDEMECVLELYRQVRGV